MFSNSKLKKKWEMKCNIDLMSWNRNVIYSDPGIPLLYLLYSRLWFRGVGGCIYLIVVFWFHFFEFKDVLSMFRAGGLSVGLKSYCQVFGHFARAGLGALERGLHTPNNFCALQNFCRCDFYTRAGSLRSSESRSSWLVSARAGLLALERTVHLWCKFWEG